MKKTGLFISLLLITYIGVSQTLRFSTKDSLIFIPDRNLTAICDSSDKCTSIPLRIAGLSESLKIFDSSNISMAFVNIEHSSAKDLSIAIICPNGQKAVLKTFIGAGCDNITNGNAGYPCIGSNNRTSLGIDNFWEEMG